MRKLLNLFFFSLFLSLPGFAQEEEETSAYGGRVIIRESAPATDDTQIQSPQPVDQEDPDLAQLERKKAEHQKKMEMLQKSTETLAKPLGSNPLQQLMELTKGQITAATLLDDKVQAALSRLFSEGHTQRGNREETLKMLQEKVKGGFGETLFHWFPVLQEISVDIIRDTQAMPGLIRILGRKEDLRSFGYIWLAMFIFVLLIKGWVIRPSWPFWKRRRYSLCFSLPLALVSTWLFYSMFQEELMPTLAIIGKYLS